MMEKDNVIEEVPRRSAEGDRKALCPRPQARNPLACIRSIYLGDFASAEATRGLCGRPLDSFAESSLVDIMSIYLRDFASAEATKGLCGRPLETFAASPTV